MNKINKVTGYQYLTMKYDRKLVDTVFDTLELTKEADMPVEGKRGSGSTTMMCLEILLTKLQTGYQSTIADGRILTSKGYEAPDYELTSSMACYHAEQWLKDAEELLKGLPESELVK